MELYTVVKRVMNLGRAGHADTCSSTLRALQRRFVGDSHAYTRSKQSTPLVMFFLESRPEVLGLVKF